eukprot:352421-Chlamydomonas_euryale.AAC.43
MHAAVAGRLFSNCCLQHAAGGSAEAIFMLAPMLLLLGQDPLMLPGLEDQQRYFPPVFATSVYLALAGIGSITMSPAVDTGIRTWSQFLLTALFHPMELKFHIMVLFAIGLSLPSHVTFLRWLWNQVWSGCFHEHHAAQSRPRPSKGLVITMLLNCASVLLNLAAGVWVASLVPLYLNGMGCAFGLIQYFAMKHVRSVGVKII